MSEDRVKLIVVALVVVVASVIGLRLIGSNDSDKQPAASRSTSSPSSSSGDIPPASDPAAAETPDVSSSTSTGLSSGQREVAENVVRAYTQYSWRDRGPTDWINRVGRYSTPDVVHELTETFGGDEQAAQEWKDEVKTKQRETRTKVLSTVRDGLHAGSRSKVTATVTYETSIRVKGGTWTTPEEALSKWVTMERVGRPTSDKWRVTHIVDTSDQGGSDA